LNGTRQVNQAGKLQWERRGHAAARRAREGRSAGPGWQAIGARARTRRAAAHRRFVARHRRSLGQHSRPCCARGCRRGHRASEAGVEVARGARSGARRRTSAPPSCARAIAYLWRGALLTARAVSRGRRITAEHAHTRHTASAKQTKSSGDQWRWTRHSGKAQRPNAPPRPERYTRGRLHGRRCEARARVRDRDRARAPRARSRDADVDGDSGHLRCTTSTGARRQSVGSGAGAR
jgi:hypothetical protein